MSGFGTDVPFKRVASPALGKMLQPEQSGASPLRVPYLKAGHVQWHGVDCGGELPEMWASANDLRELSVAPGDLLICEGGEVGRAAIVPQGLPDNTIIQNSLHLVRESDRACPRYVKYALEHVAASGWIDLVCNKATIAHLTVDKLRELPVPYWPKETQRRIANFLDEQTARIDALVAQKGELLCKIEEYLDSQTSFLLSGGNLGGERKKTGWRFLPELPAHWLLSHLRWIAKRVDVGIAEAATHAYADTGVPILRSTNVRANRIEGSLLRVEPWFAEKNVSKTLYANDLVTVRTGYPGVTAVVPEDLDGCQCFTMLITTLQDGYLPEFYARYLNSAPARGYFEVESWGSAQKNISVPILKEAYVPRLPLAEQQQIVLDCKRVEDSVGSLSSHVITHMERLREYRSSLISAAVTGQVDLGDCKTRREERLAA